MAYYLLGVDNVTLTTNFIDTSSLAPGWYNYTIRATDLAGNTASMTVTVYIPTAAAVSPPIPGITGTNPADGATGVSTSTAIAITFNRSMDTASVRAAFGMTGIIANNTVFSFSWNAGNTTMTVTISPRLAPLTTYTVIMGAGATDANGTHIAADYSFSFTTFIDTDLDGTTDASDSDDDGDGVPDTEDLFPLDPTETADNDGDGLGDNIDPDDDNDGVADAEDEDPLDPDVGPSGANSGGFPWLMLILVCGIIGGILGFWIMSRRGGRPPEAAKGEERADIDGSEPGEPAEGTDNEGGTP